MDNAKVAEILRELWRYKDTDKYTEEEIREALEKATSAFSGGEYIKKEDALKALHDFWDECIGYDGSGTEMMLDNESVINSLPTYSFPDSAENKGEITALEAENKTLRIKLENAEEVLRGLKEDLADARAELRERW